MVDWQKVADELDSFARTGAAGFLDDGQRATVAELARRIRSDQPAALLADEVGMGKTRIAVALIESVRRAKGRSVVVLPAGLGKQWQEELRRLNAADRTLLPLRSYDGFIGGYLAADDAEGSDKRKQSHAQWLKDRRKQLDLPKKGWAAEDVLMISHTFAAMRFPKGDNVPAGGWRRELLPNVESLVAGSQRDFNRADFHAAEIGHVHATRRAAREIADTIRKHELKPDLREDQTGMAAGDYKAKILPLIGYALGQFDLVIVDEAHKARGEGSSLSLILGPVIWESECPFRLGMTATPVELDAGQWIDTLGRINGRDDNVDDTALRDLAAWVSGYVDSVRRIQTEELDESLTQGFEAAAAGFREKLRPFVLRRDKRDDPQFRAFQDQHGDYRVVEDVHVSPETNGFSRDWLRRFCAAEALSLLPQDDPRVKRARLSVAQGYGFGFASEDEATEELTSEEQAGPHSIWLDAFTRNPADIYDHPAILAAVRKIETYATKGEKVLVFGRFIKPLEALTRLLDARELLRRLNDKSGRRWPASQLRESSIDAVKAAMSDPQLWTGPVDIDLINRRLADRYREWSKSRRAELASLHQEIESQTEQDKVAAFLVDFLRRDEDGDQLHGDIGPLLEALEGRRECLDVVWSGSEMLRLFKGLLDEILGAEDERTDETMQSRLAHHLQDYSGREGNFARMMSGVTQPQTRRLLQAAFNRPASWPMVLLAQSRVGREGLNLHEACRTVVLLHAEWNPGIVEQQIGRVDRKNSRWLNDVKAWQEQGSSGDPPLIHIHPVVVSGTYDDHNWQVLKGRWRDLRAQLHGDVLPRSFDHAAAPAEKRAMAERIRRSTPNFTPPVLDGGVMGD
jgi:SNF2 family DNA or RNA helicase